MTKQAAEPSAAETGKNSLSVILNVNSLLESENDGSGIIMLTSRLIECWAVDKLQ